MPFEPTAKDLKALKDVVHDWMEIDLTEDQARELLLDPKVISEYVRWGMDTVTREAAGDVLARRIVGRPWPLNKDGKEAGDLFHAEFEAKAPEKGYVLVKSTGR